jgi:hypothetical protein
MQNYLFEENSTEFDSFLNDWQYFVWFGGAMRKQRSDERGCGNAIEKTQS